MRQIRRVAVLGSGVMGATIAAQLANAGAGGTAPRHGAAPCFAGKQNSVCIANSTLLDVLIAMASDE